MRGKGNNLKIQVNMFGEFSMTINGKREADFKGNTKRVWLLIQYLLAHRFHTTPVDLLISELWNGNPCGDPKNALKNLVYRARTLLKDLSGSAVAQFILFENDTYQWNNQFECEIDSERFMECYRRGDDKSSSDEERIQAYQDAIALYKGNFLQKSSYSGWVVIEASDFAEIYQDCVEKSCEILYKQSRYDDAAEICKNALGYLPYEVTLHRLLLKSYVYGGRRSDAFNHYHFAKDLFYRQFCVDISASLQNYYQEMINNGDKAETDISKVIKDLKEEGDAKGAFYCDYDIFRSVCRIQLRMATRTGESLLLVMFTLCNPDGSVIDPDNSQNAVEKLHDAILVSLRRADIVASYSSVQFIAMLPIVTFEDAQRIIQRIEKRFRFSCRRDDIRLSTEISSLT
ncbi:MAG TPA: BTAD domain-containing putative transcriptional regulator [Caproicibacter sp.]|nr:BTAD domain-containing putative transcriptional regulator [Caproicibacter sp.]